MLNVRVLKSLLFLMLCTNFSFLLACAAAHEKEIQRPQASSQSPASPLSNTSQPQQGEQRVSPKDRIAPPEWINCPRNNLTSFEGKIVSVESKSNGIYLRMETDEATTEEFTIPYSSGDEQGKRFRLRGKPLEQSDWDHIRSADDRIRANMRAIIWACYDNNKKLTVEVVDWQPPNRD